MNVSSEDVIEKALRYAEAKHSGQFDKAGVTYFEHPKEVANRVDGEEAKIVALLHDTVEDTDATVEEIRGMFGDEIADAVAVITHGKEEPYFDYIERVKKNELARKVKLADLSHNMELSRLPVVTERDLKRLEKYKKAVEILKN